MTAQTRERLINALIGACICVIFSLFVLYSAKDYTRNKIEDHERKTVEITCEKLDDLLDEITSVSNKLDSIK